MKFIGFLLAFVSIQSFVSAQLSLPGSGVPTFNQSPLNVANSLADKVQGSFNRTPPVFPGTRILTPDLSPANPLDDFTQSLASFFNISLTPELFTTPGFRQARSTDVESIPEIVRNAVQTAFDHFNSIVNVTLTRGLERLRDSMRGLNETAVSVIVASENAASASLSEIERQIAHYNKTVQDCVRSGASNYRTIIPAARDEAVECVESKRNEVSGIIARGRQNILDAIGGAQSLNSTIQSCSSADVQDRFALGVVGCYLSAIVNIRRETILLPIALTQRFGEVTEAVTKLHSDFLTCGAVVTEVIAGQGLNVTQTIANCFITK